MTDIKKITDKNLEKKFEITISAAALNDEINRSAEKEQKTIKIDGFRKGKVPLDFIKNKYSALLMSNAAEALVEENVAKIIKDNDLNLITRPKINVKTLEIGKDFVFEVDFELFPKLPEIKFDKIKLNKQKVKIEDKDIEEGKARLLKTKAEWKDNDENYVSKLGDRVKIDFLGKIDGEAFEGGKAEGYELELGSKSFIDTFEDQLVGKKAGDQVDVKVNFPKEYHKHDLAGKPAVFEVKIHKVSTPVLPELSDEFLKENFAIENVAKLEEMIRDELSSMYENASKQRIKADIFDWLRKNVKLELPQSIIDDEFNRQWAPIEHELKDNPNRFKSEKEKDEEKKKIRENAEDSVRLGLILSEIGKANDIKVQDADIIAEIRKRASIYPGQEQMIIDFYMKNQNALNQITGVLLEDKVIDFIAGKADLEETEISAEEFLKQKNK